MIKKNIILGVICLGVAGAMALVITQGGDEARDRQERLKPVTFYDQEKDMPSFEVAEEYTYYAQDNSVSSSLTSIRDLETFEDDFLTPYVNDLNQRIGSDWKVQTLKDDYRANKEGASYWNYVWAYASYFALKKEVHLNRSVDFDYVFDGIIDCSSQTKTQVYLHEKTEAYNFQPTFNLKRYMDVPANYFVFFAKSSIGTIDAETTFSLSKKDNNQYIRYNFVFDNTYYHSNYLPTLYLGYFDTFLDKDGNAFDVNLLKNTTMIGLSYQKKAQETLTSQSSYDVMSADNDDQLEEFMKLYDIMLPFATWNKKAK